MTTAEEAHLVRFIFPGKDGRVGVVILPWLAQKTVHQYLSEPPLSSFHFVGRKTLRVENQFKVRQRLGYVLKAGDTITLRRRA